MVRVGSEVRILIGRDDPSGDLGRPWPVGTHLDPPTGRPPSDTRVAGARWVSWCHDPWSTKRLRRTRVVRWPGSRGALHQRGLSRADRLRERDWIAFLAGQAPHHSALLGGFGRAPRSDDRKEERAVLGKIPRQRTRGRRKVGGGESVSRCDVWVCGDRHLGPTCQVGVWCFGVPSDCESSRFTMV